MSSKPRDLDCNCCTKLGSTALDAWYSDFVESDWRYVVGYYATGRLPAWSDCVVSGCAVITPTLIPPLEHRQVDVRFAF